MSNIALSAISITLGVFFVFFGLLKISPIFSEDLYRDMRKIFIKIVTVFPFSLMSKSRIVTNPNFIRRIYGTTEVICGIVMSCCARNSKLQDTANCLLLLLMMFNLQGVWQLGEGLKEASHAMVFGMLLTCRIIIRLQVWQREKAVFEEYKMFIERKEQLRKLQERKSAEKID